MKHFVRLAAAVPELRVGGVSFNCNAILQCYDEAVSCGASVVVFPELAVTGCSCGDLFFQDRLLDAAEAGLDRLAARCGRTVMVVGVPVRRGGRLLNCAAVLQHGRICGFAGKVFPGRGQGKEECRYFSSVRETADGFAGPQIFRAGELTFGVEIGDDGSALVPSSAELVMAGAQVIFNPSAALALAGTIRRRREALREFSSRMRGVIVSVGAGCLESTADAVYSGQAVIARHGDVLAENSPLERTQSIIYADMNPRWTDHVRRTDGSMEEGGIAVPEQVLDALPESPDLTYFPVHRLPFVPEDPRECRDYCAGIAAIQVSALAKRMEHTHAKWVVGLSGGLDSTLALLAAAACRDQLKLPPDAVEAVGMPGFGTSGRTKTNAEKLSEILHVPYRTIPIGDAVMGHFRDIGHDPEKLDVVYENAQARERTQVLMDVANGCGGLVLGTGDLSEIALGWCTYNGDHMSMYGINGSLPKTLIRKVVAYYAEILPEAAAVLLDILDTPVSPELLPGKQYTEELIGSYELHDFFLYYFMRYGADPETLLVLAAKAFAPLDGAEIRPVLEKFVKRFFGQQFKRNAGPDGAKVTPFGLSARGDWKMPSDAVADEWL